MNDGPAPEAPRQWGGAQAPPKQVYYVLAEGPCPYLPGRRERKLITEMPASTAGEATARYTLLSRAGFRRSHQYAYRPACSGCAACVPVRVRAADFEASASLKRIARANRNLVAAERPAEPTDEQYDLFRRYIQARHGDGEMADMTALDYHGMVRHTRVATRIAEYRDAGGKLVAACLFDRLEDGLSAVYSFFEPELDGRSLGNHMVLWLIETARAEALAYVYLGYWIAQAPKMSYKARFRPLEALGESGWKTIEP
jgi:arginyl-tRNA--protein-N-Asp/Glu arginylyltransferase